jgi:hypothetical protein
VLAVDPDAGWHVSGDGRRLSDLVLVMRENVVQPAGVQVELVAEIPQRHGRALEVPSRKADAPPRRVPGERAARLRLLPQREVGRVVLVGIGIAAVPRAEPVEAVAGEAPVTLETRDVVVQRSVAGRVGQAEILQLLGEGDHLGHVLGGAREDVCRQDVHERFVVVESGLVMGGELSRAAAFELGLHQDAIAAVVVVLVAHVADVGDVLDVADGDPVVQQRAADEVGEHERSKVAQVRVAVDRRAARVHAHRRAVDRLDRLEPSCKSVAKPKRHRASTVPSGA